MVRRFAFVAAFAGLALLAGCGEEAETLRPLPYADSTGGRGDAAASATASEDAVGPPGVNRTVTVKGDLPALDGTADAHALAKPTAETVRTLATALGIRGEVVTHDGAFDVQGSGMTLSVSPSGRFSTYQGSPDGVACAKANPDGSVSDQPCDAPAASHPSETPSCPPDQPCSVPGSPGQSGGAAGSTGSEPAPPAPPVPTTYARPAPPPPSTRPAAVEAASAIVRALGLDAGPAEASPSDVNAWSVRVPYALEGVTANGWDLFAVVRTDGKVTSASGYLGKPQTLGTYPLAGTATGIERLKGGVTGGDLAVPAIACAEPDCGLPPLVVTGARLALTLVDTGNEALLVPAYAFAFEGGGEQFVPAVTDEYLQKLQPQPLGGREPAPAVDVGRAEPAEPQPAPGP